jgi:hypothetical protein
VHNFVLDLKLCVSKLQNVCGSVDIMRWDPRVAVVLARVALGCHSVGAHERVVGEVPHAAIGGSLY